MINAFNKILVSGFLLLFASESLPAHTLEDRIRLGREVTKTSEGKYYKYQIVKSIGKTFEKTLKDCYSNSSIKLPNTIEIVANIDHKGNANNIDLLPLSSNSDCVLKGILKLRFPDPPKSDYKDGYPLYFKIKLLVINSSISKTNER